MNKLKRTLALILAITAMAPLFACDSNTGDSGQASATETTTFTRKPEDDVKIETSEIRTILNEERDIKGQTIHWLGTYDINPSSDAAERSNALKMFEDEFGATITYVSCEPLTMLDTLATRILGGEPVDMFDYQWLAVPCGVYKNQYQPIDDYVNLDNAIWDDVRELSDSFMYKGKHYVAPISASNASVITYSRSLMEEEGLDDPYELFKDGEWTWSVFLDMMETFVANAEEGQIRFGINGWWGQSLLQSSGQTIVKYEDGVFKNNIEDPTLEKFGLALEQISKLKLYDPSWKGCFPEDNLTLFFGMGTWSLKESNNKNPDSDIFIVPFPKPDGTDEYFMSVDIDSYMLVANSTAGDAVGIFLECERLAAVKEEYVTASKTAALLPDDKNTTGTAVGWTEEQYDVVQSWKDPSVVTPVFDFAFGISSRMSSDDGTGTFEGKGVVNNLCSGLIEGYTDAPTTWAELVTMYKTVIDQEISVYN